MQLTREKISKIFLETALLYNRYLNDANSPAGVEYFKKRGIPIDIANKYLFGYVPRENILWEEFVTSKKFDVKELIELNIVKINVENHTVCEYFKPGRIVMPVFEDGKIVCFSARSIYDDATPRYKTLKYDKIGIFNLDILGYGYDTIYISEGIMDAITLNYMGFPAMGILGLSNFGKEHISPFLAYTGQIVLLFDNDSNGSGDKGVERVGNLLYHSGLRKIMYKRLPRTNEDKKVDLNKYYLNNGYHRSRMDIANLHSFNFFPTFVEQGKEYISTDINVPLLNLVQQYTELNKESTVRYRGKCPFPGHEDSTPSFVLYEDTNTYKCYGCNRGGSVINFLMDIKNISYKEALLEAINL